MVFEKMRPSGSLLFLQVATCVELEGVELSERKLSEFSLKSSSKKLATISCASLESLFSGRRPFFEGVEVELDRSVLVSIFVSDGFTKFCASS